MRCSLNRLATWALGIGALTLGGCTTSPKAPPARETRASPAASQEETPVQEQPTLGEWQEYLKNSLVRF